MSAKYLLFLFAFTIASISSSSGTQTEESISNLLEKVSLPPELQNKVDHKELEAVQNKTLNELKTRCEKNGGPQAYQRAQNGTQELSQCVSRLVNISTLQQEIETSKPNGTIDEVFKKYCDKKPQFEGCVENFKNSSAACFSYKEQGHLKTVHNVTLQLVEFICFKEGDRLALFIAEGGQECFQDKQDALRDCANNTMGLLGDFDVNSISDVTIAFDAKQCHQLSEMQTCVVAVLETCTKPTSANIVESIFKFIRKSTPCKNFLKDEETKARSQKAETPAAAPTFFVTTATLLTALAVTALV